MEGFSVLASLMVAVRTPLINHDQINYCVFRCQKRLFIYIQVHKVGFEKVPWALHLTVSPFGLVLIVRFERRMLRL